MINAPVPKDWTARYDPGVADFNTYIRDTFNYLTSPPKLRVKQNAVQSGIANITWTTVVMQSVTEDTYSGWVTGVQNHYTVQQPGMYSISLLIWAAAGAATVARAGSAIPG